MSRVNKKRMYFSRKIVIASWIVSIMLTVVVAVGSFLDHDMSNLTTLAALAWGELTAAHGFYFWKKKNENRAKYAQQLVKDMAQEYGIDSVARLAEVVLKD